MAEKQRIGLFGGSFDPIHNGHLNLALELKEAAKLDLVLFCPANISPFKQENPPKASGKDRLKMCEIAIEEIEDCLSLDFEVKRGGVSYTIETVKELKNLYPNATLFLLMTLDGYKSFDMWQDAAGIKELINLLIGSSTGCENVEELCYKTSIMEISSTKIRQKLKRDKTYLGHMLPLQVLDYINKNNLYLEVK